MNGLSGRPGRQSPSGRPARQPPAARPGRPTPGEHLTFALAAAVVLAHTLVAAFIALEPGVGRAAHAWGAFAVSAVLVVAVWLYPRARAGLRASVAALLGVLALAGGAVFLSDALSGGPSGDDWTGVLLLPAGAVLVGLGVVVAWRSRKPTGHRWLRRALIAVAALLAVYWVVLPITLAVIATERPRTPVEEADLGRPHEDVTLRTADGLDLAAWYVPSQNGAAVVLIPREGAVDEARMLVGNGYGVLLVDPRGYGESEGDPNMFGWAMPRDIAAAVDYLETRPDVAAGRVGGLGLSVGGEMMIQAAAEDPRLAAVVSEGAGVRTFRETFVRRGPNAVELALQYPHEVVLAAATALFSGSAPPPSLRDLVADISPRAVFLIYGENGQAVEKAVNPPYYDAAGEPREMWEVPGAGHTGGFAAQPNEYERRVTAFFDEHLLGAE
ncbi:MAG TPA: CocE/NonD family hydrolase [Thermoleophilia bacterium]|nr:CocE/NonD family hydrolase [Thermoleophilia bacterium]